MTVVRQIMQISKPAKILTQAGQALACKQALRMGYSEICFRIVCRRARDRKPAIQVLNCGLI